MNMSFIMNKTYSRRLQQLAEFNGLFGSGYGPHNEIVPFSLIRALLYKMEYKISSPLIRYFIQWKLLILSLSQDAINARWDQINFNSNIWTPAETGFSVPLSVQTVQILTELKKLSGNSQWFFPASRREGPMRPDIVHAADSPASVCSACGNSARSVRICTSA